MIIKGTVLVFINTSRSDKELFLNGCAQGGSRLLAIDNGTSALFRRRNIQKRVTILTVEDCPGEQDNNFLEVSPATAEMFQLRNEFLYFLEFNDITNVLAISLRRTRTTATFGIEEVNELRNDTLLVTFDTFVQLNLPANNTILTVTRAGKIKKLRLQVVSSEIEGAGFETSPQTATFLGFITGNRYILRFNQVTNVLEIRSVGAK
ncbi:hypothetical protein I8J29_02940 [Paenibacillus sp. MWE-103]|uniref:Uncharacterized protein n=1 Tax=Paenibacillus artemisiicola TaxID=1172618 RepID=A0ABS3W4A6_9BACL|nr:hypothetical protein [Paenibacillus artemisiicola]MBO7743137.1 hypothetical protein [Paenibacillus artemisiicola]